MAVSVETWPASVNEHPCKEQEADQQRVRKGGRVLLGGHPKDGTFRRAVPLNATVTGTSRFQPERHGRCFSVLSSRSLGRRRAPRVRGGDGKGA